MTGESHDLLLHSRLDRKLENPVSRKEKMKKQFSSSGKKTQSVNTTYFQLISSTNIQQIIDLITLSTSHRNKLFHKNKIMKIKYKLVQKV